ncbi:helix-turn-helix domain-containing protein [Natronolimnohabitans sp. A-GB9]|uniref:helix-turn-helix domain-containing protein n=1 Tax=Natronolimnohabitans sp. A-GB9 TaxID=3069757 RepID=UPI0027B1BD3B|nr:helix-turn-helix domain-containing protein [Natronolimnohabitans sp. A-GB9]MDQ2052915.1 helix-turn-helix domain-containing protein [Natronolimnohabitans sp. A-GB9]
MGDESDDIKPRDIALLQARVANPTASSRELSDLLDEEYDIHLSHNHVNTLLREMQSDDLFRKTVIPRRTLFQHYIFRIGFHYPNFKENWEDCHEMLVEDPHVLMFFNADSKYRWQLITQFRTNEQMDNWVTAFFEEHGELIDEFETTSIHHLHKFKTDAAIFDDMLSETEEGRGYLENRNGPSSDGKSVLDTADRSKGEQS